MKYGGDKKVVFQSTDKKHADLKIRLKYDGFSQQQFFHTLMDAYLEKDEDVMKFIFRFKEENKVQTIGKRKIAKRLYKKEAQVKTDFGLNEDELENIFDIIANNEEE
tara:strand:- start:361 stop:681 length:321 start_codon:yes stop_codon:yes gene_type:complete